MQSKSFVLVLCTLLAGNDRGQDHLAQSGMSLAFERLLIDNFNLLSSISLRKKCLLKALGTLQ